MSESVNDERERGPPAYTGSNTRQNDNGRNQGSKCFTPARISLSYDGGERFCGGGPLRLNSYISVVQSVCCFGVTNFFSVVDSALLYSVG